jgi:hypothetical protein
VHANYDEKKGRGGIPSRFHRNTYRKEKKAVFEVIQCDDTIEVSLLGFA